MSILDIRFLPWFPTTKIANCEELRITSRKELGAWLKQNCFIGVNSCLFLTRITYMGTTIP